MLSSQVAESGLDFVIVRTAKTDSAEPSLGESGVTVTPQGSLTGSSKATKTQVSSAVAIIAHGYVIHSLSKVYVNLHCNGGSSVPTQLRTFSWTCIHYLFCICVTALLMLSWPCQPVSSNQA